MVCILDTQLNTESTWVPMQTLPSPISRIPEPFLDLLQGSGSLSLSEGDPVVVGSQAWVSRVGVLQPWRFQAFGGSRGLLGIP